MKLTLKNIKSIKSKAISPLKKRVCNYLIDEWSNYNDKKHIFTDVLNYGCQSGVVGFLIYYSVCKFREVSIIIISQCPYARKWK